MAFFLLREHIDGTDEATLNSCPEWYIYDSANAQAAADEFFNSFGSGNVVVDVVPFKPSVYESQMVKRGK